MKIIIYILVAWISTSMCLAQLEKGSGYQSHNVDFILNKLSNLTSDEVLVAAHRADWRNAPENSLPGIQHCIQMGVDILEIDVRKTKDGKFILMHDKTLERTTNGAGPVENYTLEQLQQLKLKNGYGAITHYPVPSLEQALTLAQHKCLVYLDKSEFLIDQIHPLVKALHMEDQVFYYGHFTAKELQDRYGKLVNEIHYFPKIDDDTPDPERYIKDLQTAVKPLVYLATYTAETSHVIPLIERLKTSGRIWVAPLWPSMCAGKTDDLALEDPEGNWGWLIQHGASVICTDRPQELLTFLRKKKLHQ